MNYSQALSSTTTLTDKFLVETGSNDTLINNALALAVKISTKLALSVGYSIQDNTKPPSGIKKLDKLETVNLVFVLRFIPNPRIVMALLDAMKRGQVIQS